VLYLYLLHVSCVKFLEGISIAFPLINSEGKRELFVLIPFSSDILCSPQEKQCVEPSSFINKASLEPQSGQG
jgi:hypothetical protein